MTLLHSIFLALLQGLTEFLPVSSSGHLVLAQKLWNVPSNLFFDVVLHFGTLLAVLVVYRSTIARLLKRPFSNKLLGRLLVASVPTFAIALVVKLFVPEHVLVGLLPIGFATTIVLIVLAENFNKGTTGVENCSWLAIVATGIVQGIAVFPGLSRSGSTICTMRLFGLDKGQSADFSFLLSIPVILASVVVESWEMATTGSGIVPWYCIVVGVVVSFASGFVALNLVKNSLAQKGWMAFAVYLVVPFALSAITLFA